MWHLVPNWSLFVGETCPVVNGADRICDRWLFKSAISHSFLCEGKSWRSAAPVQSYKEKRLLTVDCRWKSRTSRSDQPAQAYTLVYTYHAPPLMWSNSMFRLLNRFLEGKSHAKPFRDRKSMNKHSVILFYFYFLLFSPFKTGTIIIFNSIEASVISGFIFPSAFYRESSLKSLKKEQICDFNQIPLVWTVDWMRLFPEKLKNKMQAELSHRWARDTFLPFNRAAGLFLLISAVNSQFWTFREIVRTYRLHLKW